jgi:hypothetical protein
LQGTPAPGANRPLTHQLKLNFMLVKHNYCPLPKDWEKDIKECCPDPPIDDPTCSDCCYDAWNAQLRYVKRAYKEADEKAKRYQRQLDSALPFRDKFKAWYEDLFHADELAGYVCQRLHVLAAQVTNICCTTKSGEDAINTLYCMVRDFYIRVDKLKEEYDTLLSCIKCLNRPELSGGIIDCLAAFNVKLEAVIATRDKIIELLLKAVKIAFEVHAAICSRYGLQRIIREWQVTFECTDKEDKEYYKGKHRPNPNDDDCCLPEKCDLKPMLTFPLDEDPYFEELKERRDHYQHIVNELMNDLVIANKEKEVLLANKDNLEKAIAEVDPKNKCKA